MALNDIKICTVRSVPDDKFVEAASKALEENPMNAPMRSLRNGIGIGSGGMLEMAVLTEKRWSPGRTLRVKFLDGVPEVQQKVEHYAKQWADHANIGIQFVGSDEDAEIRISFLNSGSWSYLGTDALVINASEPTMNYGWLTPTTADDEYSRVVLHEFGHALACIHEHSHPEAGIPWDRDKVYEYYRVTNGWDRGTVDRNVLNRYTRDETNFSAYDPTSIMQYSVPRALTVGGFEIGWNRVLSATDKSFIGTIYPGAAKDTVELSLGTPVSADIGEHGEEDQYTFRIAALGDYVIETTGQTDVLMALYRSDDRTIPIAEDDDSGHRLNARIAKSLGAGEYYLRVRHYWPTGTGEYGISVKAAPAGQASAASPRGR
jgi:hypothetical protein